MLVMWNVLVVSCDTSVRYSQMSDKGLINQVSYIDTTVTKVFEVFVIFWSQVNPRLKSEDQELFQSEFIWVGYEATAYQSLAN